MLSSLHSSFRWVNHETMGAHDFELIAENVYNLSHDFQMINHFCLIYSVQMPESEDGGSLLGSSKRSLADTSVTSTADLSIFSSGDRRPASQQQNENGLDNGLTGHENLSFSDVDLNKTVCEEDAENGESSPK